MKTIIKNIRKSLFAAMAVSMLFVSCQEDETIPRTGKPAITLASNSISVTEGQIATFDLTLESPVATKVDIRIDVLDEEGNPIVVTEPNGDPNSGNGYDRIAIDDINVPYSTWFESGWFQYGYLGGSGYVRSVPAGNPTFQIDIETLADGIVEGTETVTLRLSATSLMEATIDETITIDITD